ncbi:hypothetical protein MHBO_000659 [Bonamia ostreae]|uniref:Sushi domain-containing protein n=1 Tax=Bonamia ostreae TaxID=126728 RepID=A0ABV2AGY4_9EUKA
MSRNQLIIAEGNHLAECVEKSKMVAEENYLQKQIWVSCKKGVLGPKDFLCESTENSCDIDILRRVLDTETLKFLQNISKLRDGRNIQLNCADGQKIRMRCSKGEYMYRIDGKSYFFRGEASPCCEKDLKKRNIIIVKSFSVKFVVIIAVLIGAIIAISVSVVLVKKCCRS